MPPVTLPLRTPQQIKIGHPRWLWLVCSWEGWRNAVWWFWSCWFILLRFRCYDSFDFLFIFLSGFFKRGRDVFSLDLFSVAELGSIDFVFFCCQSRIFFDCYFEISFLLGVFFSAELQISSSFCLFFLWICSVPLRIPLSEFLLTASWALSPPAHFPLWFFGRL